MPARKASAVWEKGLRDGTGRFQAASGAFEGRYSFTSRFEDGPGTNPEELLAAAHAACFSMALSLILEKQGKKPERIETTATCTIEKEGEGFKIKRMQLDTRGKVPGLDAEEFRTAAEQAKDGCPVSGALKGNLQMTVKASLMS